MAVTALDRVHVETTLPVAAPGSSDNLRSAFARRPANHRRRTPGCIFARTLGAIA